MNHNNIAIMQRLKDTWLDTLQTHLPLVGTSVCEIGCGDGSRTMQIASACATVQAFDPNPLMVANAQRDHAANNTTYRVASAEQIPIASGNVDVVIFTLSFHHVPVAHMSDTIDEAIRIVKPSGHIVFFEPTFTGTLFEAEMLFQAWDGDERKEKAFAYAAILSHPHLQEVAELFDETLLSFTSADDFVATLAPKSGSLMEIEAFLQTHSFQLRAGRRINIFRPSTI